MVRARHKFLRVAAIVSSVLLVGVYVSCRAAGKREKEAAITGAAAEHAEPPYTEPAPAVFPGSKSAEVDVWYPPSPPQPDPMQQPKRREVMPGSKSAPMLPK